MKIIDGKILITKNFIVGTIYTSKFSAKYQILDIEKQIATIKFIDTGYIKKYH